MWIKMQKNEEDKKCEKRKGMFKLVKNWWWGGYIKNVEKRGG